MPHYHYHTTYHQHTRFLKKARRFGMVMGVVFLFALLFLGFDIIRELQAGDKPSRLSEQNSAVVTPNIQVFRTLFFQFQAPSSWVVIDSETNNKQFVYRSLRGPLIEQELRFYVNDIPNEVEATHVLPVTIQEDGQLTPLHVSDHCRNSFRANGLHNPSVVSWQGVRFFCNPESANFTVVVGKTGGGTTLKLNRPDGGSAIYFIVYQNLTAQPTSQEIEKIVESFQTR